MPAATPGQTPNAVAVSNPSQFQEAVRQGVKHIVINDHLDMVGTPRFSETTIMDAGMIAISPNQNGEYTNSIRGNCSNPPPNLSLDPPRKPNQCIIQVREDFLESSVENSQVWVSNLYITLPGEEKNHTTLIGVHGGDVYLTDMTFVADGDKARAIDVKPNRRLYVAQSHFSQFSKDKDGVIRLEPGSKATLDTVTFQKNTVATGKADAVAAGPVMGLYAGIDGGGSLGAAAWFQNCRFGESTSAVPGDVSVESRSCRVYSNTKLPTVWDLDLQREVDAWPLAVRTSSSDASGAPVDVFADVSGESGPFLRPNDGFFSRVVQQQAKDTGMEPVVITPLPDGNEFVTADPYAGDDGFWTDQNIGLIVGLCGGAVILSLITLAVAAWYFRFRKSSDVDKDSGEEGLDTPEEGTQRLASVPSSMPRETAGTAAAVAMKASVNSIESGANAGEGAAPSSADSVVLHMPPKSDARVSSNVLLQATHLTAGVQTADGTTTSTSGAPVDTGTIPKVNLQNPYYQPTDLGTLADSQAFKTLAGGERGVPVKPGDKAAMHEHLRYICDQLDSFGRRAILLEHYELQGEDERCQGGQAVVQYVRAPQNNQLYAIKLFAKRRDYDDEKRLYLDSGLGDFMPAVLQFVDNEDGAFRDMLDNPMPPCIVMEKGESLHQRMGRCKNNLFTTVQIIGQVAQCVADLHGRGWVHRDLKPGNIMFLPRSGMWTLIDFGLTARRGDLAHLSFTLLYAAPEVIAAKSAGEKQVKADPAVDVWALGVMAFELLTNKPAFNLFQIDTEEVTKQLMGESLLPWEGPRFTTDVRQQLGVFKDPILSMLNRTPEKRSTCEQFSVALHSLFAAQTTTVG